tara:strand:+ start:298 stop:402 length:105 start_codon:yes stop_codon:yes gene_type:complete
MSWQMIWLKADDLTGFPAMHTDGKFILTEHEVKD